MDFIAALGTIIILDLVLAGDNAVVIALAARRLPYNLRKRAIYVGTAGAIIIRILMTIIATYLLTIPFLQAIGGLLLLPIAIKLLNPSDKNTLTINSEANFLAAVKTIMIADAAMGIDNVLAIAGAAHGNLLLVVLGLLISVPIIVWGSNIIAAYMNRFPLLVTIGASILAYTSGIMIIHDFAIGNIILDFNEYLRYILPIFFIIIVITSPYMLRIINNKK